MVNTEEQRLDLIKYCDYFIDLLGSFPQVDHTPEGRMKAQVIWLKERAENNDLTLPVDNNLLSTIRYIYTDGVLMFHASSPDRAYREIEVPMQRIIAIAKNGKLIYKPEYATFAVRYVEALISVLKGASRSLSDEETGLIDELADIKAGLSNGLLVPPLGNPKGLYPNYLAVDTYNPTISDLPKGKEYIKTISSIVFSGTRPDAWVDLEAADEDTKNL